MKFTDIYRCVTSKINLLCSDNGNYTVTIKKGDCEIYSITETLEEIEKALQCELSCRLFQSVCLHLKECCDLDADNYSVSITGYIKETKVFE